MHHNCKHKCVPTHNLPILIAYTRLISYQVLVQAQNLAHVMLLTQVCAVQSSKKIFPVLKVLHTIAPVDRHC